MQLELADPSALLSNPWNSNRVSPQNMEKLKRSITELGFATAVVVRTIEGGALQILGGQHRTLAAIDLGISPIPVLNLGEMPDDKAMKIGLVDNHRFGNDDTLALAKIFEEIGASASDLSEFLPVGRADIESILGMVDIDLDDIGVAPDDDDKHEEAPKSRPAKTHDVLKFRMTLADAEKLRAQIEQTIRRQKFDDKDEMTAAGDALAFLLFSESDE